MGSWKVNEAASLVCFQEAYRRLEYSVHTSSTCIASF